MTTTAAETRIAARTPGAFIGISGWRYAPWRGDFYPKGLAQKNELAFAAQRFGTIELNGSFYSLQRPESYARWYDDVPEGFVFAIKGSRYITHMLRLRHVEGALANLLASGVFELREKLGPFLWQLPPSLAFDPERLSAFFALLPRTGAQAADLARRHDARVKGRTCLEVDPRMRLRHALEVRHPSFERRELIELLRRHQIALVVADTAGKWPLMEDVTADFVYVRLHGDEQIYESGYSDTALDGWADKVAAWLAGDQPVSARTVAEKPFRRAAHRDVYVYFDNDIKVRAPYDALTLSDKVAARVEQPRRRAAARRRSLSVKGSASMSSRAKASAIP
jgi:uncharacterized protein YecE (DUF72 family)